MYVFMYVCTYVHISWGILVTIHVIKSVYVGMYDYYYY